MVADTTKFAAALRRELKTLLKTVPAPKIPVDADTSPLLKSIRKAQAEVDRSFRGLFDKIKDQAGKAGEGIGGALAAGFGAAATSGIAPAIASIVALLSSIAPAALTAIPAAVGTLGTMKVALLGVGDALKEVGSDQEAFDEVIEDLSLNAQKFARSLRGLMPQLTALKNAVQDRFFAGFDKDLTKVSKNLLGPVRIGMSGVASDLNRLIRQTNEYVASTKGADATVGVFRATRQVLAEVNKVLGPLVDKFLDLVIAGTDAKKINSALLTAKATLKSLAEAAGNVKDAVGSIFSGLGKDGPAVAAGLAEATGAVKEFLASAQAQALLATLGNVMDRIRAIAIQILGVLPSLTPAINGLATGGFGVLLTVVEKLVNALAPLAEDLGGQEELFKNVGAAIGIYIVAVKAYQAALVVATAAQVAWKVATIAATIATTAATAAYNTSRVALLLLSTGFTAAGVQATLLGAAVWRTVTAMGAAAASALRTAAIVVASQIQQTAAMLATDAAWLALIVRARAAQAATIAVAAAQRAVVIATNAWTAVQWLLNAALTANPIGVVIATIVALVAAIVIAYQKSETFRSIVQAAFSGVAAAAIWLWENALKPLWDGIVAGFEFVKAAAALWWTAVQAYFQLLAAAATTLWNWITTAWNGIVAAFNFVVAGAASFVNSVIGFFGALVSAVSSRVSSMIGLVASIPGRVLSAVGNLGGLLYNAGRNIIQGLINGVTSMIGRLTSTVSGAVQRIRDFLPFSPAKIGPLSGSGAPEASGRRIAQGVAAGIQAEQHTVAAAMNQMASNLEMSTPEFAAMNPNTGANQGASGCGQASRATAISAPCVSSPAAARWMIYWWRFSARRYVSEAATFSACWARIRAG